MERLRANDDENDELLVELHERLLSSGNEIVLDAETVDDEFRGAVECLNLIERVRRQEELQTLLDSRSQSASTSSRHTPNHFGHYQLERELGRGGAGVVWLAYDTTLKRPVALKIPHLHFIINDSLRQRFSLEASVTARFNHPHIVKIHEFGSDGPIIYFASEFCDGPNLHEWQTNQSEPVSARAAAAIIRDLASAVQHAHAHAVIHRDIKPSNVLVVGDRDEGGMKVPFVKLCDFSLAKLLEDDGQQTRTGDLLGTPIYMSPEQAQGRNDEIDVRTDVYSLGALLFELITGVRPFDGENQLSILHKVVHEDPLPVRSLRTDAPLDLAVIVARCLEKEPARRFASAQELADELERYLDGRPILSRPVSPLEQLRKWVKRKPMAASFWGVVAISVIGAVLGTVTYAKRMSREAQRQAELNQQLSKTVAELEESNRVNAEQAYPNQIRRAHELVLSNHPDLARVELDRLKPSGRLPDLRGWDWDFVDSMVDQSSSTAELGSDLYASAISHDQSRLCTAGKQGVIWITDLKRQKIRHWNAEQSDVNGLAFHPDGKRLASAGKDGSVKVWDADTGTLDRVVTRHQGEAYGVSFSHDGRFLASGGGDHHFVIIDFDSKQVALGPVDCGDAVEDLAWSQAETLLAAGLRSGGLFEAKWDGKSFQIRKGFLGKHGVKCLRSTPDGKWFASAGPDGRYGLFRSDDLETLWMSESFGDSSRTLAISPDSRWIATANRFDLEIESFPATDQWIPPPHSVTKMAATTDGSLLATFVANEHVRLFELPSRRLIAVLGDRPLGDDGDVAFSPDGKWLVIASQSLEVVDIEKTKRELISNDFVVSRVQGPMEAADFSPDGKRLYLGGWHDGHAEVIDFEQVIASRGNDFNLTPRDCHTKVITSISSSPDGRFVATASADDSAVIWDPDLKNRLASQNCGSIVFRVEFSPNSRWMAAGTSNGRLWIFDAEKQHFREASRFQGNKIEAIAFSPDSANLLINTKKWNQDADKFLQPDQPSGRTLGVNLWLPSGQTLFGDDEGVYISDGGTSPKPHLRTRYRLQGHCEHRSKSVAPDGPILQRSFEQIQNLAAGLVDRTAGPYFFHRLVSWFQVSLSEQFSCDV